MKALLTKVRTKLGDFEIENILFDSFKEAKEFKNKEWENMMERGSGMYKCYNMNFNSRYSDNKVTIYWQITSLNAIKKENEHDN